MPGRLEGLCRKGMRGWANRTLVWLVLLALLGLGGGAYARATPTTATLQAKIVPIPVSPSVPNGPAYPGTGDILGAGAAFEGEVQIRGDEYGGFPPPVVGFSLWAPIGFKLHPQGFPICPQTVLESHEVEKCPKGSRLTSIGSVSGVVSFGASRVHETLTVQAFFAAGGRIAYFAEGTSPALVEVLGSGGFTGPGEGFGPKFSAAVPLVETVPEAPYAVVQSVHLLIGAAHRQGSRVIPYVTLPSRCGKAGLTARLEIRFLIGAPVRVDHWMPCPARR